MPVLHHRLQRLPVHRAGVHRPAGQRRPRPQPEVVAIGVDEGIQLDEVVVMLLAVGTVLIVRE